MSKKLIIGIIAVVVIIAGGVFFVTKDDGNQNNSSSGEQAATNTEQQPSNNESKGNIFSLSDSGKPQKCTFTYSGTKGNGTGTMYTDGSGRGLMQIEVQTAKGNTGKSNTLVLSDKVYGWMETGEKSVGFVYDKAKLTQQTQNAQNNPSQTSTNTDPNQSFDLQCDSWSVDEAMLSVPKNVNFTAMPAIAPRGN